MTHALADLKPLHIKAGQVITLKDEPDDVYYEVIYVGKKNMKVVQSGKNRERDAFHCPPARAASIYMDVEPKRAKKPLSEKMFSRVTQMAGFGRQWFFVVRHDPEKEMASVCTLDRRGEAWSVNPNQLRNMTELSFLPPKMRSTILYSGPDKRKLAEIEAEEARVASGEMSEAEVMQPLFNFRGEPWTGIPTASGLTRSNP